MKEPDYGLWEYLDEVIARKASIKIAKLLASTTRRKPQTKKNDRLDAEEHAMEVKHFVRKYRRRTNGS